MKAYSMDLRAKVLRAVDQGTPREEIVKVLGVSRATIKRYIETVQPVVIIKKKVLHGLPSEAVSELTVLFVPMILTPHHSQALEEE